VASSGLRTLRELPAVIGAALWLLWSIPTSMTVGMGARQFGELVGISITAVLIAVIPVLVLFTLWQGHRGYPGRAALASMRMLIGLLAGLLLTAGLHVAGIEPSIPAWIQVLVPAVTAPYLLDVADGILQIRRQVLRSREDLVREAVDLASTQTSERTTIAEIRSAIMNAVDLELSPARSEVARRLELLTDPAVDVALLGGGPLRDVAHDSVRPVMAALAIDRVARPEPLGLAQSVRAIIATQPFHPVPLAVIYAAVNLPQFWEDLGPSRALVSLSIGVVLIFAILGLGNSLMRRTGLPHSAVFITFFAVLQLPTIWDAFATNDSGTGAAMVSLITSVMISGVLVLLTSSVGSWRQRQETAQQTFRDLLDDERIASLARARIASQVARDAAQTLHGPVQARLAACAVAMDAASRTGDIRAYSAALRSAQEALETPLFDDVPEDSATVSEAIARVVAPWRGIIQAMVSVDPALASDRALAHPIEQIVEEALTNAARHGRARSVAITVRREPSGNVLVTVDDDGQGPTDGAPALGSALLDRVTGGHWSLTHPSPLGGSRLQARVG